MKSIAAAGQYLCAVSCIVGVLGIWGVARADFDSDMAAADSALRVVMPQAKAMVDAGDVDSAVTVLLGTFPEKTRTPIEECALGSVISKVDPKTSYILHKQAAVRLPEEANVQLEWAMEQHRAGEYVGASESYAKCIKAKPSFALTYGLMAECLIRDGKTKEAVDAWRASEEAPGGTLEQFESWVCDVNFHRYPKRERAELIKKVQAGDIDAAEQLIWLDARFPVDWWNDGPEVVYLKRDLALLRKSKFAGTRITEILCAGDCIVARSAKQPIGDVMKQAGFLMDDKGTLPESGRTLSIMLPLAIDADVISHEETRAKWGEILLAKIKTSKDAELINVSANLYEGTDKLAQIDSLGWDATGDVRFAGSFLAGLHGKGELKLDDARLKKAEKQFPEDWIIADMVVRLRVKEQKPPREALINAIKAEYTHFSPEAMSGRPGATQLRRYFMILAKETAGN